MTTFYDHCFEPWDAEDYWKQPLKWAKAARAQAECAHESSSGVFKLSGDAWLCDSCGGLLICEPVPKNEGRVVPAVEVS